MPERVRELYEAYFAEFQELEQGRRLGAGVFGLGGGPRDYPCHGQFAKKLERLLEELEGTLTPEQAEEVVEYILFAHQARNRDAVYWMVTAVHGMTAGLIGKLEPAAAAGLASRYERAYPRREQLPAQKKALTALRKRGK